MNKSPSSSPSDAAKSSARQNEHFDDLIALALPDRTQDETRRHLWIISVNILFLAIGLAGAKERTLVRYSLEPIEDQVIEQVDLAPTTLPPETPPDQQDPQDPQDTADAPAVVAVTLDSPAITFSVPTVGSVLVPASAAKPPPARPMVAAVKKQEGPPVFNLQLTGEGGDRPPPTYPLTMQNRGIQGTVYVLISVDANGRKQDVKVKESSGYRELDDHVCLWILKHWIRFPEGEGERIYRCALTFKIE